ncbi:MAG: Branched-chain amino acid ABC-type transport system, permease component [Frankiales bacterium]|nr:Branched-chain amino acid ABC-type transport system, permease component [Frankiales bacterium]
MGQVLVFGLISGGIYGLFALGVVMVFRGTGVLSFAQGEIGTAALYVAAYLINDQGLPWVVGALGALVFGIGVGVLFELLVVRRMIGADPVSTAVATVGLLLLITTIEIQYAGSTLISVRGPISQHFAVFGVEVTGTQVLGVLLALALGFGLQSLLRRTDFGLGILAAAQDPTAVRLVGVPLSRVSATVWGAGAALSVIAALLVEPGIGVFAPGFASQLYLVGLAAAVIGGLTSLPGAVIGGLALGLVEAAANKWFGQSGVHGLRYVVVLIVLLVVLVGRQLLPELRARFDTRAEAVA